MRISLLIAALAIAIAALWGCTAGAGGSADATNDKTVTRSPGKPLHPIQVRAVVDGELKAGVETTARLIVDSARPAQSVEVEIQPELATVISSNRFQKRGVALERGQPVELDFRFSPTSDQPQPLKVLVRVTDTTGRVLTREVTLSLGEPAAPAGKRKIVVEDVPEPEGDVVVPARQEIKRGD